MFDRREEGSKVGALAVRRLLRLGRATVAVLPLLLIIPREAAAYLDPISGSIILQVLAAAALGGLLTIKRVWAKVTGVGEKVRQGITRLWKR